MSRETPDAKELSFEDSLARLEEVVRKLESGDAPLEQGLLLFEEGIALSRRCHDLLELAETRVGRLVRDAEGGLGLVAEERGES
jgi:exodeoxyribonuclease VII small subunit